ncbi:RNA-directed DNA polymerase from mobile element jockey [Trichonephila clavipes]|nr:RNA-directed DNA polymerase from mobile element jockey [Trichonephila clavipes]
MPTYDFILGTGIWTDSSIPHLDLIVLCDVFLVWKIPLKRLTLRYFSKPWKTAVIVPILKPGKNSALAESYRPISLLPVLSKLAEKGILARLNDHLERENTLIREQHGFRPRLSTPTNFLE